MFSRKSCIVILMCTWALTARPAAADTWNERTTLTFSAPVMVPGATLPAGSYVFELVTPRTDHHALRIRHAGGDQVVIVQTVPLKRLDPKGDVVLRFDPTDAGTAPALRGFFYPGSLYGHELVYSNDEATRIASRTRTLVLAAERPGEEGGRGTVRVYDATGSREWQGDAETLREWQTWREQHAERNQSASRDVEQGGSRAPMSGSDPRGARAASPTDEDRAASTTAIVQTTGDGRRVDLDDLETAPGSFIGQTISVDAEIEDVYGPRLFTIDEPNWADLDREVLVHVPTALAALVDSGDRVTVTGRVEHMQVPTIEREWGWLGFDPEVSREASDNELVLVASEIVGGTDHVALLITADDGAAKVAGPVLTSLRDLDGQDDATLVGRRVKIDGVRLQALAANDGFYGQTSDATVFVLPAEKSEKPQKDEQSEKSEAAEAGATVTVEGVVLRAPKDLGLRGDAPDDTNEDVYILATSVTAR